MEKLETNTTKKSLKNWAKICLNQQKCQVHNSGHKENHMI